MLGAHTVDSFGKVCLPGEGTLEFHRGLTSLGAQRRVFQDILQIRCANLVPVEFSFLWAHILESL